MGGIEDGEEMRGGERVKVERLRGEEFRWRGLGEEVISGGKKRRLRA